MALLKDLLVNGVSRLIGDVFILKINAPTATGGTTFGPGTSGLVLKTNGSTIYWDNDGVNSATEHYTPSTNSGSALTKSASGGTAAWSVDVVKGITISRDAKGHVTDLSITSGKTAANPLPALNVTHSAAAVVANNIATWNAAATASQAAVLKDSGKAFVTTAPSSSGTDALIPTSKAVWSAISGASGYGKEGTVTSVRVLATSPLASSVNTALSSTLDTTISFSNVDANKILAGPSSGNAAAPDFRALVADDIPALTPAKSGLGNAKIFYGTSSTAAAAKTVTCSSFTASDLVAGTIIFITFSATNTGAVASLSLNINSTGAKNIKFISNATVGNLPSIGLIEKNTTHRFVYNGTLWIASLDNVTRQTVTTSSSWRKVLLHATESAATTTAVATASGNTYAAVGVSVLPSTGTLAALNFQGNGSALTNLNASNVASGTLSTSYGGTGVSTTTANTVFAGPSSGNAAAPSFRTLEFNDIPNGIGIAYCDTAADTAAKEVTLQHNLFGDHLTSFYIYFKYGNTALQTLEMSIDNDGLAAVLYVAIDGVITSSSYYSFEPGFYKVIKHNINIEGTETLVYDILTQEIALNSLFQKDINTKNIEHLFVNLSSTWTYSYDTLSNDILTCPYYFCTITYTLPFLRTDSATYISDAIAIDNFRVFASEITNNNILAIPITITGNSGKIFFTYCFFTIMYSKFAFKVDSKIYNVLTGSWVSNGAGSFTNITGFPSHISIDIKY